MTGDTGVQSPAGTHRRTTRSTTILRAELRKQLSIEDRQHCSVRVEIQEREEKGDNPTLDRSSKPRELDGCYLGPNMSRLREPAHGTIKPHIAADKLTWDEGCCGTPRALGIRYPCFLLSGDGDN